MLKSLIAVLSLMYCSAWMESCSSQTRTVELSKAKMSDVLYSFQNKESESVMLRWCGDGPTRVLQKRNWFKQWVDVESHRGCDLPGLPPPELIVSKGRTEISDKFWVRTHSSGVFRLKVYTITEDEFLRDSNIRDSPVGDRIAYSDPVKIHLE